MPLSRDIPFLGGLEDELVEAENEAEVNQSDALFGVDGLARAVLPLPGAFAADHDREGVDAHLIGSGIGVSQVEFYGRTKVFLDTVVDGGMTGRG